MEQSTIDGSGGKLEIAVIFTTLAATLAALRRAASLADCWRARVVLVAPQIVPFPLDPDNSPVSPDFHEQRLRPILAYGPDDTAVRVCLCRRRLDGLLAVLSPRSLVLIGGPHRWWQTAEERLARQLRCAGQDVIFVEAE